MPSDEQVLYDWYGIEAVSPKIVTQSIEKAKGERLDVYINSPGGDIYSGSEIYAALQEYKGEVLIHVVGRAASAASVIAMAGQSDIARTAMFMLHNVSVCADGDQHMHGAVEDLIIKFNKSISTAYQSKTGKSEKEILALMDNGPKGLNIGTWLTAEEAVANKFIDKIAESNNLRFAAAYNGLLPQEALDRARSLIERQPTEVDKLKAKLNLLKVKVAK